MIITLAVIINTVPMVEKALTGSGISVCIMKNTTGIPCMGCRGTRAALAFTHGRLDQSLAYNPLLAIGAVLCTLWAFSASILGWQLKFNPGPEGGRLVIIVVVFLIIGNWIYVIAAGG